MIKRLQTFAPPAAMIGGLLWIVYSILLLLKPWGDIVSAPNGMEAPFVIDAGAFALTAVAGAGALALLTVALPATVCRLQLPMQGAGRVGVAMAGVAMLAAPAAAAGGLLLLPTFVSGALMAGEVLLAFGVMLVAIDAAGSPASGSYGSALFIVGVVGMLGLMAQALVALAIWMLPVYGALVMAVYGLAWVRFGSWLYQTP
jgi:hypothetical protein